ncbi:hypothetical protein J7M00_00545 [bacterium]|nr:hypothetical protein [bacterium]
MKNYGVFLLLFSSMVVLGFVPIVRADDLILPDIHAEVALQSEMYFGEDDTISGYLVPDDAIVVRQAVISAEGELGKYVEYFVEFGTAACMGRGAGVQRKHAGLLFKPCDFLKVGIVQDHAMRGFELYQCCMEVLTAEKPRFSKTLAPCHPLGAVIETDIDITGTMGIATQFGYFNGPAGTFDEEHDINLGLTFRTPLEGLSVAGFYTDWLQDFEYDGEPDNGFRTGFGLDFDRFNAHLRGEYYLGKGFYSSFGDSIMTSEDLKMNAFYIEGAYAVQTGWDILPYIQPYAMYQSWDKASNVDGDHTYSYLTAGVSIGLGEYDAKLRIDYEMPLSAPDDTPEEAGKLVIRIQGGI